MPEEPIDPKVMAGALRALGVTKEEWDAIKPTDQAQLLADIASGVPIEHSFEPGEYNRSAFSMSRDDGIFWIALTIFGTGLYLVSEHAVWGAILSVLGIAGLIFSMRNHMPPASYRTWIVVVSMAITTATVGYDIYDRHFGEGGGSPIQGKIRVTEVQSSRKETLQKFYADAGPLLRRQLTQQGEPSKESLDRLQADAKHWEQETTDWLEQNLGPAARERFLDISGFPSLVYGPGYSAGYNEIMNRVTGERKNLSTLLESGAYDK